MKKRYFWALTQIGDHKKIYRFRSAADRRKWSQAKVGLVAPTTFIKANHPEVRRVQRQLDAGEVVTFPVEIN